MHAINSINLLDSVMYDVAFGTNCDLTSYLSLVSVEFLDLSPSLYIRVLCMQGCLHLQYKKGLHAREVR